MRNRTTNSYSRSDYGALMASRIPHTLANNQDLRFDSAEDASVFFARELDHIKSQTYDVVYPEFTAVKLFPQSSEANEGAETITYYSYDKTGIAKIIDNYSTDIPRVDTHGKPSTAQIKSIGDSYGYSVQEMRASRLAGKSLDARKAESARYAIDYQLNRIAWAGDPDNGLVGVLTEGNDIPVYTPASVTSLVDGEEHTEWEYKTPEQILDDINGMQKFVAKITKNVERPDTLVLPADVYIHIATKQIPHTGYTVKRFLMENAPYLKTIESAAELQADAEGTNPWASEGLNVGFLYTNDPRKLTIENPMPFYQYPLQTEKLEVEVICEARTAGAIIYYPLSALIAVGI